ncbi:MAG: hypothetical protein ACYDCC_08455 [Actinomycetota bacterium]
MSVNIPVHLTIFENAALKAGIRAGNRSLLFRVIDGNEAGIHFGACIKWLDRAVLDRGQEGTAVLEAIYDEVARFNKPGLRLAVWYGSDVGTATVLASAQESTQY